jgi:hypothetical protein
MSIFGGSSERSFSSNASSIATARSGVQRHSKRNVDVFTGFASDKPISASISHIGKSNFSGIKQETDSFESGNASTRTPMALTTSAFWLTFTERYIHALLCNEPARYPSMDPDMP